MPCNGRSRPIGPIVATASLVLALASGPGRAVAEENELRSLIERQSQQLEQQSKQLELQAKQVEDLKKRLDAAEDAPAPAKADPTVIDDNAIRNIIGDYLQKNPGAGMPPSVQTGYFPGQGFVIRSTNNPTYAPWKDESKIPFELQIHGQMQMDYYFYKVTDTYNHLTQSPNAPVDTNDSGDFSSLMLKRGRIFFTGNMFDPNLKFNFTMDGNTRGITSLSGPPALGQGTKSITGPTGPANGTPIAQTDNAVRIFNAFISYDWHPCCSQPGCSGPTCPGNSAYSPTVTFLVGKAQPYFCLEEMLGQRNQQFVEFSMADFFFDSDDNNQLMMAGAQMYSMEDRLFLRTMVTSGNDSQTSNLQLTDLPGIQNTFWYDFGGTWNANTQSWQLFGTSLSDLDYSPNPVLRVGGATNLVPMGRRSQYSSAELTRVRVDPGAPGGTQIIQAPLLTGDGRGIASAGGLAAVTPFALDAVNSYTYEFFTAFKYRGFSLSTDNWVRDLCNFQGIQIPGTNLSNSILYTSGLGGAAATPAALFPAHRALIDFGQQVQGGYFVVPHKLELIGRWSYVDGDSGDINGNGTYKLENVPGVSGGPVKVVNGAFTHYHMVNELAAGFNYYLKGQLVKWSTDVSYYKGGNPAQGGQSLAGFIPGEDGYMLRTQLQLAW